jgi:glycosyltransferase involved in cell wall biosynthesis
MRPALSIILCTHNPRRDYLDRVLHALREQTLLMNDWELLLVDNASDQVLSQEIDLSWHPQARHVKEDQLGLTPARLKGIQQSQAEVLVFVDDDNVLDSDYLETTLKISKDWAILGAWGGQINPEFEQHPPEWTKPYWNMLAVRQFQRDRWSNTPQNNTALPCGAGLCIRKQVAQQYATLIQADPHRLSLDRRGNSLSSCGDSDLALTACDMELGTGMFTALHLIHLLPAHRLQEDYLLRLVEGITHSNAILKFLREGVLPFQKSRTEKLFEAYRLMRVPPREVRFHHARERGMTTALQTLLEVKKDASEPV